VARLELEGGELARAVDQEIRQRIVELGRRQGFTFVALDLAGFASGSLNQLIGLRRARPVT
jgi:uncharacterized protein